MVLNAKFGLLVIEQWVLLISLDWSGIYFFVVDAAVKRWGVSISLSQVLNIWALEGVWKETRGVPSRISFVSDFGPELNCFLFSKLFYKVSLVYIPRKGHIFLWMGPRDTCSGAGVLFLLVSHQSILLLASVCGCLY